MTAKEAVSDETQKGVPTQLPLRVILDEARLDAAGGVRIVGWALAAPKVLTIKVFSSQRQLGTAVSGLARPDVGNVFPNYPFAASGGFSFVANCEVAEVQSGMYLEILQIDGESTRFEFELRRFDTVSKRPAAHEPASQAASSPRPEVLVNCDLVRLSESGRVALGGWTLAQEEIAQVEVLMDGLVLGHATLGLGRPDVNQSYPAWPKSEQAGISFNCVLPEAQTGEHAFVLRTTTVSGLVAECSRKVTAVATELEPIGEVAEKRDVDAFKLHIDLPASVEGAAVEVVKDRLVVVGWALAKHEVDAVNVYLGEFWLGRAYFGMRRQDIEKAFPEWPNSLLCGYALTVPVKMLRDGVHHLRVVLTDKRGGRHEAVLEATVAKQDTSDALWPIKSKVSFAETSILRRQLEARNYKPTISLLIPIDDRKFDEKDLLTTLNSLARQSYADWRVSMCLGANKKANGQAHQVLKTLPASIKMQCEVLKAPYSSTTKISSSGLVGVVYPGVKLAVDALMQVCLANANRSTGIAQFIYGDERCLDQTLGKIRPFFKPDWSPDLLLSTNYIGPAWFADWQLIKKAFADIEELVFGTCYGNVLRLTEHVESVLRVPHLLLERPKAIDTKRDELSALSAAMKRRGIRGASITAGYAQGAYVTRRKIALPGKVSIIIPTIAAKGLIRTCIDSIRRISTYKNVEIILLDNMRKNDKTWKKWFAENADVVVQIKQEFNWALFNNVGAAHATGDYLLFLNDDIEVIQPDWIEAMIEIAQRPDVGVVGPLLLYPDNKIQHAGLFLSKPGHARHAFRFSASDDPGYFGLALTQRNVVGVTGACMMVRRNAFDTLGGFNEAHKVVNNDLDFCLRSNSQRLAVIYTPNARLVHHELASRAEIQDDFDESSFASDWMEVFAAGDPFYHPNLSVEFDDYAVESEPLKEIYAGYPLIDRSTIKKILIVKLDHIGDFVTSLPAIRRLKSEFPDASLSMLVGPSVAPIARGESVIDQVFVFSFFHVRSGLGVTGVGESELQQLRTDLARHEFDLAVDFRKHLDTRHVLQYTAARYLCGFDQGGQFPWLDVTCEWEGDVAFQGKKRHVAADLVGLALTISFSCEDDRSVMSVPSGASQLPEPIRAIEKALFSKPVVCVHPASGSELRQWPERHFALLIDLLVTHLGVHVAVIGSPDEAELAKSVLNSVQNIDKVWSLVGQFRLTELPIVLSKCQLFVGNNSGPQHIAAGIGVPTVAVHSAVIASEEWGPLGTHAVALRREMDCGPCYLAKKDDCYRQLACLTEITPMQVLNVCRRFLPNMRLVGHE